MHFSVLTTVSTFTVGTMPEGGRLQGHLSGSRCDGANHLRAAAQRSCDEVAVLLPQRLRQHDDAAQAPEAQCLRQRSDQPSAQQGPWACTSMTAMVEQAWGLEPYAALLLLVSRMPLHLLTLCTAARSTQQSQSSQCICLQTTHPLPCCSGV